MFDSLSVPVLFAHRGASAHAPENTMPAFELAVTQGAKAIELDVQLSADDSVVVIHDSTLSRTTNGFGKVHRHTLDQLKSLHSSASFGSVYPDVNIPTLEEVFSRLDPNVFINIELKNTKLPFTPLAEEVSKIVARNNAEDRVLFSSFNSILLKIIGRFMPDVPRGLLIYNPIRVDLLLLNPRLIANYQSINISFRCVTKARVSALHRHGKKVFTYTLNHPEDIQRALNCGVDGFFTDDPALGFRTLDRNGYNSS